MSILKTAPSRPAASPAGASQPADIIKTLFLRLFSLAAMPVGAPALHQGRTIVMRRFRIL